MRGKSLVEVTEEGHFSARIGESMVGQMLDYFPSLAYFFFSVRDILTHFEEKSSFYAVHSII